jgi:hypothetical protein
VVVVGSIEVLLLCSSFVVGSHWFVVGSHWFVVGIEAVVKTEEVAVAEGRTDLALVSGGLESES